MMVVKEEATYIPQHKIRLVLFFLAMRHFADDLKARGHTIYYVALMTLIIAAILKRKSKSGGTSFDQSGLSVSGRATFASLKAFKMWLNT
jgi:deoxyribodipyrimidine photolyase-like uncharacterized protein